MSWFTVFAFVVGAFAGMLLTCMVVASGKCERSDETDALIYQAGWSEGYRQGKRDREE